MQSQYSPAMCFISQTRKMRLREELDQGYTAIKDPAWNSACLTLEGRVFPYPCYNPNGQVIALPIFKVTE